MEDGLGEYDFEKYVFRALVSCDNGEGDYWEAEANSSDVVEVAVYKRNLAVSERFNCSIQLIPIYFGDEISKTISRYVTSGEDVFDLASCHAIEMGNATIADNFLNWYDIPNVDFTKPWWSASNIETLTHNGVCLSAIGDAAVSAIGATYCVFYNKKLGADNDLPDMYEIVRNGEWTIDKAVELSKDLYDDLNQDGKVDNEDLFGYTSDPQSNINAYLWAFDNPIFKKNGDALEFVYKTEKVPAIIEKLVDSFTLYDGTRSDVAYQNDYDHYSHGYSRDMFKDGRSVFANGYVNMSLSHFRDLEDEFAILPYPKWDEAQENYATMADGYHEVMAVPLTAQNLERVGTITEALCAESYKTLIPAYYDKALKVKGARDADSVEMIDMLVNSRVFDFGYLYDGWKGCSFFMQNLFGSGDSNFESYWQKQEKTVTKHYNEVIEYFENYDH